MAQKRVFQIATPRGSVYQTKGKGGTVTARLEWNPGFAREKSEAFSTRRPLLIPSAYGIWTRLHRGSQDT